MEEPSPTPWKVVCLCALAAPVVYIAALAYSAGEGPACADLTGANGYTGPGFAMIAAPPPPACSRVELPPLRD